QANKPNFDRYYNKYPHNELSACGLDVGLPEGQMGNSEVGHLNIGAGRVVYQSLTRINKSIEDGDFFEIEALKEAMQHVVKNDSTLHLMGLLSDGGVHSHYKHLFALLELAKKQGVEKVYVHAFLDGRDVDQKSALKYIEETETKFNELGIGQFASVSGRYYAMDRDKRWDREEKAYNAIRNFGGETFDSAKAGVEANYAKDLTDEFVEPFIVKDQNNGVNDGDAVIFYNFRPDRAGQLSEIFTDKAFEGFKVEQVNDLFYATFTKYNDNVDAEIVCERRRVIDSPKVATYDLKPEMSAYEVKDALIEELDKGDLDLILLNFANPDMVGHSGMLEPTIKAIEAVDECLGEVVDKIIDMGGHAIVTADHGNSDMVLTDDEQPMTTHTTNPVPVIVTKEGADLRETGRLGDLAPTLLDLLNVKQPEDMTGESLIKHKYNSII